MHVYSPVIQCRCKSSNSSVKHRIVGLMDAGGGASQHFSTWQVQTPLSLSDSDRSPHTACRHTNIPINNEYAVPASSGGRKLMMSIHDVPMRLSIKTAACVRKTQHFVLFVGICIIQYLKVFVFEKLYVNFYVLVPSKYCSACLILQMQHNWLNQWCKFGGGVVCLRTNGRQWDCWRILFHKNILTIEFNDYTSDTNYTRLHKNALSYYFNLL